MGWPQPIAYSSVLPDDRAAFELEFLDLLKLQDAYVSSTHFSPYSVDDPQPKHVSGDEIHESDPHWKRDEIYPLQALISPIALRFKFHFESKRDTNRLDKVTPRCLGLTYY